MSKRTRSRHAGATQTGSTPDTGDEYHVDNIGGHMTKHGNVLFLVKWRGFPGADTYEPLSHCTDDEGNVIPAVDNYHRDLTSALRLANYRLQLTTQEPGTQACLQSEADAAQKAVDEVAGCMPPPFKQLCGMLKTDPADGWAGVLQGVQRSADSELAMRQKYVPLVGVVKAQRDRILAFTRQKNQDGAKRMRIREHW